MNTLYNYYKYLKLWYWWNFVIKQDEFHNKLNTIDIYYELRYKKNYKHIMLYDIIVRRRTIAHCLDNGDSIMSIPVEMIVRSRL